MPRFKIIWREDHQNERVKAHLWCGSCSSFERSTTNPSEFYYNRSHQPSWTWELLHLSWVTWRAPSLPNCADISMLWSKRTQPTWIKKLILSTTSWNVILYPWELPGARAHHCVTNVLQRAITKSIGALGKRNKTNKIHTKNVHIRSLLFTHQRVINCEQGLLKLLIPPHALPPAEPPGSLVKSGLQLGQYNHSGRIMRT